jgi:hypothetical protein
MGEETAATTMASDDAKGRDMDALEPGRLSIQARVICNLLIRSEEIERIVPKGRSNHDLIRKVQSALESFRARFLCNDIPTSSDIHSFLDSVNFRVGIIPPNLQDEQTFNSHRLDWDHYALAIDATLGYVVKSLKESLQHNHLVQMLNEVQYGKHLVTKAAELGLRDSLTLMVELGAMIGPGTTPKEVYEEMERYDWGAPIRTTEWGGPLYEAKRTLTAREKVHNVLDLTTVFDTKAQVSRSLAREHWGGLVDGYNGYGFITSPQFRDSCTRWAKEALHPDQRMWIHVHSTNVSSNARAQDLIVQLK